jgi:hypothetical protein
LGPEPMTLAVNVAFELIYKSVSYGAEREPDTGV